MYEVSRRDFQNGFPKSYFLFFRNKNRGQTRVKKFFGKKNVNFENQSENLF